MRVLFVVSRLQETKTVFRLAERMAEGGCRVLFLFIQDGCRHPVDRELMGDLDFAEGLYALEEDCRRRGFLEGLAEGVDAVGYSGWVELLEACDRVISWV